MLNIKWTERVMNDEVFQREKEGILLYKKIDATRGKGIQLGITIL